MGKKRGRSAGQKKGGKKGGFRRGFNIELNTDQKPVEGREEKKVAKESSRGKK